MRRAGLLIAAGVIVMVGRARAESKVVPPQCSGRTAPFEGGVVPANAPAIALTLFAPPATEVSLRSSVLTGPGDVVLTEAADPVFPDSKLLMLAAELSAGAAYRLDYEVGCTQYGSSVTGFPRVLQTRFTAAASAPLPTKIGKVLLASSDDRTFTYLALAPSPELTAFLPLTSLALHVRGAEWARMRYGLARLATDSGYALSTCRPVGLSQCVPLILSRDQMMTEGATEVRVPSPLCRPGDPPLSLEFELSAHVAGAATDPPPLLFTARIPCGEVAQPPVDKTPPKADAGPGGTASVGMFSCATSANGAGGGIVAWFIAALLFRRRR